MTQPEKRRVLVVDDDLDLREAIAFDLRRRNYEVFCAASGREAFKIVQAGPLDLVISDIRMPDGDGVELLKKVREHNYEIPILMFVTGFADLSLEDAYQLGADAVFSKPFIRADFFAAIDRALTPHPQRWAERSGRQMAELSIELKFPDLDYSLSGHLMNIGRGGIFVALPERIPSPGTKMEFKVAFENGEPELCGSGIVRWSRPLGGTPEKPAGCGIEFNSLGGAGMQRILDYTSTMRTKAFIPSA